MKSISARQKRHQLISRNILIFFFQAKQFERERWEREREELLHMKFTTNANSNLENGSDTAILIDRALEHSSALHVSKKKKKKDHF